MTNLSRELTVHLPRPHPQQAAFIHSPAKRKVIRAGRRGGKTVGNGIYAVEKFLAGKRVLYGTPTTDQINRFWITVVNSLQEPIQAGIFYKNESEHIIELKGTEQRIRAKTCWNADTLRGDYADELILDEYQLMNEDTWGLVGAPMMLDKNGNATFIYTPPSLHTRSVSKANDPQHAAKLFKKASQDSTGRWQTFNFTSFDNPYLSTEALDEITQDMTAIAYRMEIMAEDIDESPGALWTRKTLEDNRVLKTPILQKIMVGVDPSETSTGDECGIIVCGSVGHADKLETYCLADYSIQASPAEWAKRAVTAYYTHKANTIIAESNAGGEMVEMTIHTIDPKVPVKLVHASRGKQTRAEPVAAVFEQKRGHMVGSFPELEDEMCIWVPGDPSPNRMDALVWACTELMEYPGDARVVDDPFADW